MHAVIWADPACSHVGSHASKRHRAVHSPNLLPAYIAGRARPFAGVASCLLARRGAQIGSGLQLIEEGLLTLLNALARPLFSRHAETVL